VPENAQKPPHASPRRLRRFDVAASVPLLFALVPLQLAVAGNMAA